MSLNAYDRLAPFIKDYIYKNKWIELHDVQVAACEVIFDKDSNLLLSSGTASGKTEAAFLPVLTQLCENPSSSVGVLYVSPLKALINDQFYRLDYLLKDANIPVYKWHGDVSQNYKDKLLKNPKGVLQTTPESLEAMLMHRKSVILTLFSDLKYIIIDEVHYFMNNDRGIQLLCILERIQRLIGNIPRRIGLSATLGDYSCAEEWLSAGTNRDCITPLISSKNRKIRLHADYFFFPKEKGKVNSDDVYTKYTNFLFENTRNKRCIIFANTKAEIENIIANLKQLADERHLPDYYYVHHGSISAALREYTEAQMKTSEKPIVTGATVTLELGIDIGNLQRVVQIGSPHSASSFLQRLGRTGRRGNAGEMLFSFTEDEGLPSKEFYNVINWDFIKCIAIIQLYLEEQWIEPISSKKYPYEILYHQTMSFMASNGETSPAQLAQNMLTLNQFQNISQEDYKILLKHLISIDHLQKTERNGLLVGLEGEREINKYTFYAVFSTPVEYSVINNAEEIGTVQTPFPLGARFALAGKTWEVIDINLHAKTIFVQFVKGKSKISWTSNSLIYLHRKVLLKMKEVLCSDTHYSYLSENAFLRLNEFREVALKAKIDLNNIIPLAGNRYVIFPWVGSKALSALSLILLRKGLVNMLFPNWGSPVGLILETDKTLEEIKQILINIRNENFNKFTFEINDQAILRSKFSDYIPDELLKKEYLENQIDIEDMQANLYIQ